MTPNLPGLPGLAAAHRAAQRDAWLAVQEARAGRPDRLARLIGAEVRTEDGRVSVFDPAAPTSPCPGLTRSEREHLLGMVTRPVLVLPWQGEPDARAAARAALDVTTV